jgi:sulfonate dioxygenase
MLAERGVVVIRNQPDFDLDQQTTFVSHFGPLHLHASSGVPSEGDLPHVHVVYKDSSKKAPPTAFSKLELWHADVR